MSFRVTEAWRGTVRNGLIIAGVAVTASLAAPSAARADFRVCNGTQTLVGVAIGYRDAEGWISEGWWRIPPSACRSVVEGNLKSRFYYLYAEDDQGRSRWAGDVQMCIAENEFRVVDVKDCFARGFQEMGFREYDTGQQGSWMVQLTETPSGSSAEQ
ncbi:DUF1036 domain-containing protein [Aureimonas frigidaquae]|uniref:DUF1036 domain-containing protein n=1 Tax=Aureimonas frigidaquae TaxID=424757 RepID=UPI000784DC33|nr:DUF1036 domain-containing protein [Aureimonas frigidaquae]